MNARVETNTSACEAVKRKTQTMRNVGTSRFARQKATIAVLGVFTVIVSITALAVGRYPIPVDQAIEIFVTSILNIPVDWNTVACNTVMNTRVPRIVAALLIGAALAESGACYQGIFKNPMVSPDLLGVSAGACVGAGLGILLDLGSIGTQAAAFVMALVAVTIATAIPRLFRSESILMLVLAGIVVSGFMTSILGLMKFLADPNGQLADIVFWTMGSLNGIQTDRLAVCAPVIIVSGTVLFMLRWRINVLSLPDAQSYYLGTEAPRLRRLVILFSTLMTASAVCLSGTIGWVGLVVPHMSRLMVGVDNRFVVPASILLGALFLLVADTLARTVSTMSIPISVITGLVGAPLFVVLLLRQRKAIH